MELTNFLFPDVFEGHNYHTWTKIEVARGRRGCGSHRHAAALRLRWPIREPARLERDRLMATAVIRDGDEFDEPDFYAWAKRLVKIAGGEAIDLPNRAHLASEVISSNFVSTSFGRCSQEWRQLGGRALAD